MNITLYSTNCPKCKLLEKELNSAKIEYNVVTDTNEMQALGLRSAPALKIDEELMDFGAAVRWVNSQGAGA